MIIKLHPNFFYSMNVESEELLSGQKSKEILKQFDKKVLEEYLKILNENANYKTQEIQEYILNLNLNLNQNTEKIFKKIEDLIIDEEKKYQKKILKIEKAEFSLYNDEKIEDLLKLIYKHYNQTIKKSKEKFTTLGKENIVCKKGLFDFKTNQYFFQKSEEEEIFIKDFEAIIKKILIDTSNIKSFEDISASSFKKNFLEIDNLFKNKPYKIRNLSELKKQILEIKQKYDYSIFVLILIKEINKLFILSYINLIKNLNELKIEFNKENLKYKNSINELNEKIKIQTKSNNNIDEKIINTEKQDIEIQIENFKNQLEIIKNKIIKISESKEEIKPNIGEIFGNFEEIIQDNFKEIIQDNFEEIIQDFTSYVKNFNLKDNIQLKNLKEKLNIDFQQLINNEKIQNLTPTIKKDINEIISNFITVIIPKSFQDIKIQTNNLKNQFQETIIKIKQQTKQFKETLKQINEENQEELGNNTENNIGNNAEIQELKGQKKQLELNFSKYCQKFNNTKLKDFIYNFAKLKLKINQIISKTFNKTGQNILFILIFTSGIVTITQLNQFSSADVFNKIINVFKSNEIYNLEINEDQINQNL